MKHADRPRLEVAPALEWINQPPGGLARESDRHGVDGEVAPEEIVLDRRGLDAWERGRGLVALAAGGDHVDVVAIPVLDDGRSEGVVWPDAAGELLSKHLGELLPVALDGEVDVEGRLAEQDVPDRAADEVDAAPPDRRHRVEHGPQALVAAQGVVDPVVFHPPILPPAWGQSGTRSTRFSH